MGDTSLTEAIEALLSGIIENAEAARTRAQAARDSGALKEVQFLVLGIQAYAARLDYALRGRSKT